MEGGGGPLVGLAQLLNGEVPKPRGQILERVDPLLEEFIDCEVLVAQLLQCKDLRRAQAEVLEVLASEASLLDLRKSGGRWG